MLHGQPVFRKGFALPTVLIASIVLLSILAVGVSATASVRTTLKNQYYAQLAQIAGEAGVAYAKACLAANGNVPLWTNAKPLKPTTDCYGDPILGATVKVLVVAGGGSGGTSTASWGGGGGGGGGGVVYNDAYTVAAGTSYGVTVGAGGAGVAATNSRGNSGGNSVFGTVSPIITAIGGGGGGSGGSTGLSTGIVGGSGGGGGYKAYTFQAGANGTVGQGNKGGDVLSNNNGGGGGGAGGVGGNTNSTGGVAGGQGGLGGAGLINNITGANITYAKGGEGGTPPSGALAGAANTGNGGSGVYGAAGSAAGGSGVVIVSYPANSGIVATGGSPAEGVVVGTNRIHKFTTTGSSSFAVSAAPTTCPTDARCSVSSNGNIRSSFSVGIPNLDTDGKALTIPYNGYVEILRSSNGAVWKTITQPSIQPAVVSDLCSATTTSALGWNNAIRATTQDNLSSAPAAQSITVANTTLNAGSMYFRKDFSVGVAGTYNVSALSSSNLDTADVYIDGTKLFTSSGSVSSASTNLTPGCHAIVITLTNEAFAPKASRVTASVQRNDGSAPLVVTDSAWRVSTGDAVHYSMPNYYASPAQWVAVRDLGATGFADNTATRNITTPVTATAGYSYVRDDRTVTLDTTTEIRYGLACSVGCVLYIDGEQAGTGNSSTVSYYQTTLQPGKHKFAMRNQGTSGSPYFYFSAWRLSDFKVLSQSDTNWSTTNTWTTAQDFYSYDTDFIPTPNPFNTGLVSILAVGGGGGGGTDMGGGGGGGGVVYEPSYTVNSSIDITVGAGGAGALQAPSKLRGSNGGNTKAGTILAFGGGGGGSNYAANTAPPGSGASAGGNAAYLQTYIATGIFGQGNGTTVLATPYYPSGGGGAGGVGGVNPGTGGVGIMNDILGPAYYWGGGGGGSGYTGIGGNGGNGGGGGGAIGVTTGGAGLNAGQPGGGGATASQANVAGGNAGANTGGGGGGGSHYNATNPGGNGGSGIVVISYPTGSLNATGGTITTVGSRTVHTFTSSGTFSITPVTSSVKALVVAGGGSGGGSTGGGGGAGGMVYTASSKITVGSYPIVVGAGGAAVSYGASGTSNDGANSSFNGIVAIGGGGGGNSYSSVPGLGGRNGGSGGGGQKYYADRPSGVGIPGQGYAGGALGAATSTSGGGGAGGVGASAVTTNGGANGGLGATSDITGATVFYAGGGGSGASGAGAAGSGGSGIGGNGSTGSTAGTAGAANTGSGGGGGWSHSAGGGGAGGSGIVIIAYPTGALTAIGGTVTTSGGYTIHTFTISGTFKVFSIN